MSRLARRFGELRLAYVGGGILAVALIAMGLLPLTLRLMTFLELAPLAGELFGGQRALLPPMMAISAAIGVGFALLNIPTQAVLMDRAPVQSRGRIFSALLVLQNVAAIAPLAFLGALADLFGVARIVGTVGFLVGLVVLIALRERRQVEAPGQLARAAAVDGQLPPT
jgi:MFS family permease